MLSPKWNVYTALLLPQGSSEGIIAEEGAEKLWEPESVMTRNSNFWTQKGSCTYEHAGACPTQTQAKPNPSMERGGAHEGPSFTKELAIGN